MVGVAYRIATSRDPCPNILVRLHLSSGFGVSAVRIEPREYPGLPDTFYWLVRPDYIDLFVVRESVFPVRVLETSQDRQMPGVFRHVICLVSDDDVFLF